MSHPLLDEVFLYFWKRDRRHVCVDWVSFELSKRALVSAASLHPATSSSDLQVLDLSCNRLTTMAGLETLSCLRELNLASNPIQNIGERLSALASLSYLNLAATPIGSFAAHWQLSCFPALHSLLFSDPLYGDAALANLHNYRSSAVRNLPFLQQLDGIQVSEVRPLILNWEAFRLLNKSHAL